MEFVPVRSVVMAPVPQWYVPICAHVVVGPSPKAAAMVARYASFVAAVSVARYSAVVEMAVSAAAVLPATASMSDTMVVRPAAAASCDAVSVGAAAYASR